MIDYIYVKKIFGEFDYKISLENQIKLIIGPNGCGKTTFFKIIHSLISQRHAGLYDLEFESIEVGRGNDILKLIKKMYSHPNMEDEEFSGEEMKEDIEYYLNGEFIGVLKEQKSVGLSYFVNNVPNLFRYGAGYIIDRETNQIYDKNSIYDLIKKYHNILPNDFSTLPKEATKFLAEEKIDFISTERLLHEPIDIDPYERNPQPTKTINVYSKKIKDLISNNTSIYAKISQNIDQVFPKKIVDILNAGSVSIDKAQIQEQVEKIQNLRNKLINTSVIEPNNQVEQLLIEDFKDMDGTTLLVLQEYYKSTLEKLESLEPFANQIELFLEKYNKKLNTSGKKINIDHYNGFYITNRNEEIIDISKLSSGEQHEFIQLYSLIFNTKEDQLILIDEPEISLQVSWQREYVEDLESIIKHKNLRVIIATHSVQIVNNNWDKVLNMGEVE
ncbi:hypothetical protein DUK53_06630 [Listeria sp. SHR_NRA_18]|uniref:AAA family ATPase n=1 Tax=Listeria sp. SHR_NRA_18 TaxID=2269046 RepID=UPI00051D8EE5|nr:AAA family ATPase [Listeria sp. SHR_NRA_18]KGL41226.1 hypothetical protein EP56_11590 [Listeriaceae bacterium FSL A5-0209]RQW67427.1 hypothetical protein DUK53_06630 [Listeria sp. SHR_NRA_18]